MKMFDQIHAVKQIIDRWDPMKLSANGAAFHEYDQEVWSIACSGYAMTNPGDVAEIIHDVFEFYFARDPRVPSTDECMEYAAEIYLAVVGTKPKSRA